jgi:hypothetical protein
VSKKKKKASLLTQKLSYHPLDTLEKNLNSNVPQEECCVNFGSVEATLAAQGYYSRQSTYYRQIYLAATFWELCSTYTLNMLRSYIPLLKMYLSGEFDWDSN